MRILAAFLLALTSAALIAQTLPPGTTFVRTYDNPTLGVPGPLGGLEFSADGRTLYVGGAANAASGAVYALPVVRDAANLVIGFGAPVQHTPAPEIDGGLQFGPGGTLFWTTYSNHQLGQLPPGGTYVEFPLTGTGVPSSTGSLEFVPAPLPNAGDLLVASYSAGDIYTVPLTPNGNGTYTPGQATLFVSLPAGTEGMRHIPSGPSAGSMVIVNYSLGNLSLLRLNLATGMPIILPGGQPDITPFITGVTNAEGIVFDPITNDFFVSTYTAGNQIYQFSGFPGQAPVVAPATYSVSSGQPIVLPIDMGTSYAGAFYAILVGATGNAPGVPWSNTVIPLNFDALTFAVVDLINQASPLFQNFFGTLDAQGQATATFDPILPLPPSWAGVNIDFCLVTSPPDFASLPAAVLFVP
jgi:hypothetical protein